MRFAASVSAVALVAPAALAALAATFDVREGKVMPAKDRVCYCPDCCG